MLYAILNFIENSNKKCYPCQWHSFTFFAWFIIIKSTFIISLNAHYIVYSTATTTKWKLQILWKLLRDFLWKTVFMMVSSFVPTHRRTQTHANTQRHICKMDRFFWHFNKINEKKTTKYVSKEHDFFLKFFYYILLDDLHQRIFHLTVSCDENSFQS